MKKKPQDKKQPTARRWQVVLDLSEQAYHLLAFHAADCGHVSPAACVRRDVAACVQASLESLEDEQIERAFELAEGTL